MSRANYKKYNSDLIRVIAYHMARGSNFVLATKSKQFYRTMIERDLQEVQIIENEDGIEVRGK